MVVKKRQSFSGHFGIVYVDELLLRYRLWIKIMQILEIKEAMDMHIAMFVYSL